MSLINEALKKARHEAAQGGDRRHGVLAPSHSARRRSLLPWIVAATSVALAVGVVVGVALRDGGTSPLAPPSAEATPVATGIASEAPALPAEKEEPPSAPASDPGRLPKPAAGSTTEAPPAPEAPASVADSGLVAEEPPAGSSPETRAAEEAAEAPAPEPPVPAREPGPVDGESYLRRVALPGGEELVLNGIAWSGAGPVALLNGRAVERGEFVSGWKVERIERQEVELSSEGASIRIRLK